MFIKEYAENIETLSCTKHVCDTSTQEMEAGRSNIHQVLGMFEARLGYE